MKAIIYLVLILLTASCAGNKSFTERSQKKEQFKEIIKARNQSIPKF